MGDLYIDLLSAKNFLTKEGNKPANAVIKTRVIGDYGRARATKKQKRTHNPVNRRTLFLVFSHSLLPKRLNEHYHYKLRKKNIIVQFEAYDKKKWKKSSLGYAKLLIEHLPDGKSVKTWVETE